MNATGTALRGKHAVEASELYMAFELSEKNWKLALGDGVRGPVATRRAGDTAALLECIAKAKARCGLAPEASGQEPLMKPDATASASAPLADRAGYRQRRGGFCEHRATTAARGAPRPTELGRRQAAGDAAALRRRGAPSMVGWYGCRRRRKKTRGERTGNWGGWGTSAPLTSIGFVRAVLNTGEVQHVPAAAMAASVDDHAQQLAPGVRAEIEREKPAVVAGQEANGHDPAAQRQRRPR